MEMTLSLIYLLCATTRLLFKDHFYLMFDPYRVGPYRQNYWYSRKGQVLRKKLFPLPPGTKSLNDIYSSAHLTNSLGLTKPNPDYSPYAILQTLPPPDPDPPDPDPPTPDPEPPLPDTIYEVKSIALRHYEDKALCFIMNLTPGSGDKLKQYIPEGTESTITFQIWSESLFALYHVAIIFSDDYDFATGAGEFAIMINQPAYFSDDVPEPSSDAYPFNYIRRYTAPFNIGFILIDNTNIPSDDHLLMQIGDRYELTISAQDSFGDVDELGASSICQKVVCPVEDTDGVGQPFSVITYNVFNLGISTFNPTQAGKNITFPDSIIAQ